MFRLFSSPLQLQVLPLPLPYLLEFAPQSLSACRKSLCNQPIFVSEKPMWWYLLWYQTLLWYCHIKHVQPYSNPCSCARHYQTHVVVSNIVKLYCDCYDTWAISGYLYMLIARELHSILVCFGYTMIFRQIHRNCETSYFYGIDLLILIYMRVAGTGSHDTWDLHHDLCFY